LCVDAEAVTVEIETADKDAELGKLTDLQKTTKLFAHVRQQRQVSINGRVPTLDDVRAVMTADFNSACEVWKVTALKKVVYGVFVQISTTDKAGRKVLPAGKLAETRQQHC